MGSPFDKRIWATWSGGIDSTALVGKLLQAGYEVFPIAVLMGPKIYRENEREARVLLTPYFREKYPDLWHDPIEVTMDWLRHFSSDGGHEIPRRNKHIMDYVMMNHVIPNDFYYLGMGSHLGADPAAVDHLKTGNDTDSRHMMCYFLTEYGIHYQFVSLLDFGPSRYKTDRIRMMLDTLPHEAVAFSSYNCLAGKLTSWHCGECYKCVERHAAFEIVLGPDRDLTMYIKSPKIVPYYEAYLGHFKGIPANLSWEDIRIGNQGSHKEN